MNGLFFKKLCAVIACCLLCSSCLGLSAADRLRAGIQHYESGRYGEALAIFAGLADQGSDDANAYLGRMYRDGTGVEKDRDKAIACFSRIKDAGRFNTASELETLYAEKLDAAAALAAAHQYHGAVLAYRKIPEQYYRGRDYDNLGNIFIDEHYYGYNLDAASDAYEKAIRHGYADAAVGLNRIDMIIGDTMGGFNRILEYFNRSNSPEALQALIDSPVLGRWNYVGVTDDYLVLTSREVAGDAVRKVWTYYYPRKKQGGTTRELTSYQCAARQYATHATAAFDEHDNITDVFSTSQNPPAYAPVVAGSIGENIYNYACFSVNKAEAIK